MGFFLFIRRIGAALLVAAPSTALGIVLLQWVPLPAAVDVQWSGTGVSTTQPLWVFFIPIGIATLLGFGMAIAATFGNDREDSYRGTFFIAATLTAGSAGICVALLAINFGYAAPTGPAVLSSLALAPIYALIPCAVVSLGARRSSPLPDQSTTDS